MLVGRTGSRDLSDTGLHDLKHLWNGIVQRMTVVLERYSGPRVVLLSAYFRSRAGGVKYCWNMCS